MSECLSQKPGIQLIKSGTSEMVDLEKSYQCPGLKSSIIDLPITDKNNQLTLGRFEMRPSVDFPFFYEYLEVKTIITGKIVVKDEDGVKYEAEPGDVFIFTPPHLVMFCAESDGTAVYLGHRGPEPSFLPGFDQLVETTIPEKVKAWWKPFATA
jgi:ethanolamine utilization protein EutQ (cupin superfamily)